MKKTIFLLIAFTVMATATFISNAQYVPRFPTQTPISEQRNADKFVIEGNVALDIPDSCYNVYMTDLDGVLTDKNLVACVQVKDKKFRFETDLAVMKQGRIQAIFPGNELCPAWINLYFIPGFTLYMTVHDGYYDIHNQDQYQFMTSAWLNENSLPPLLSRLRVQPGPETESRLSKLNNALTYYRSLSAELKQQLNELKQPMLTDKELRKEAKRILDRIENINAKMEELITKYADSIE